MILIILNALVTVRRFFISAFFLFFLLSGQLSAASPLKKAFAALREYDYFQAKKRFYGILEKSNEAFAAYGLAIIYARSDNPFTSADSAAKYTNVSFSAFRKKPVAAEFSGFRIDSAAILSLADSIAAKYFQVLMKKPSIGLCDKFLATNYLASVPFISRVISLRDELELNAVIQKNSSDSTLLFIETHPESTLLGEAILLRQRQLYNEFTHGGKPEDFKKFISAHPRNVMVKEAYESLFRIYRDKSDAGGLKDFVKSYPTAPQANEAWKLLFSLTVKTFSSKELEKFLKEYPDFPFRHSIQKELELNRLVLYPYEKDEVFGFIDTTGKPVIKPQYDAVTPFSEGLAVVSKNDSVYYVNKENKNPFGEYFSEAYEFKSGIAAVKKNQKWFFINRQGQIISPSYEEISELSSQVYVVKQQGRYGAVNFSAQTILEPRFQKLGDFKNDFAYYTEDGKYGFVSKSGSVHKAVYDWISDFSDDRAIVKVAGQYGIINSYGYSVLDPEYELILRAPGNCFVIVKNGLYGFYSGAGCFISQIAFDFYKEKPAEYYTNGAHFRLIKKSFQTLMDINGKHLSDFETYEETNFLSNGLYRVKKNKKYGYAERKLVQVIPAKYTQASDFSDSTAVVELKDRYALIDLTGKNIFSSEEKIERLSPHFFLEGEEEARNLINHKGMTILSGITGIQKLGKKLFIFTLNNGEIRLISD